MDNRIKDLFATLLQVSPSEVTDQTRPDDLERWDSMQHLILVSGFEEEFDVDLDPEDLVRMYENFGAFKRVIQQVAEAS